MKILGRYLLGAILVIATLGVFSCGDDEPSQADELCTSGCTVYQDCAEEWFNEDFRDLAECIETCHENYQGNYDHDLAIDTQTYGAGAKRCLDLEVDYTICFNKNATCGEWNAEETPTECYGIAEKTVACWNELDDVGVTDPISTDDTDSATSGQCNSDSVAACEEQSTNCLQQEEMAPCMEAFCQCIDATGCETYQSCMADYA